MISMTPQTDAGTMSQAPLIEIRDATVWRGTTRVYHNFSLTIEQHEQVAILGPNGCGKTTLLKLINRELYPVVADGSWVRILGRNNWNVWDLRSRIGIVSHDLHARYRDTTLARDVVVSGFLSSVGIHGILHTRVTAEQELRAISILSDLGIADLADTPFGQMSTGQQRRCLLARALVHEPETLILDEPTSGLDLAASFDYLERVRRLVAEGRNVVLVTHSLNEIPPEIERVILICQGQIIADGQKDTVLTVENLRRTYDTRVRLTKVDGYYLAYPAERP
jgi:iron complex transport system ATP-binding protein